MLQLPIAMYLVLKMAHFLTGLLNATTRQQAEMVPPDVLNSVQSQMADLKISLYLIVYLYIAVVLHLKQLTADYLRTLQ